jgi:hypothetical protein
MEEKNAYMVLMRKLERKRPLERHIDVSGRIILRWILGKQYGDME